MNMATEWMYQGTLVNEIYGLLERGTQPRYFAELAPMSEAGADGGAAKVEPYAQKGLESEKEAVEAGGIEVIWQPRPTGMKYMANIERMVEIATIFEKDFINP